MQAEDVTARYRESNWAAAQLVLWTLVWVLTLAVARFGPELVWDPQQQSKASWAAVGVNVLAGVAMIIAFARFLRSLDDLWRKIIQDALAVALGVGWVAAFGYIVADRAGLVAKELNVATLPVLMGGVYLIAIFAGWIRYR